MFLGAAEATAASGGAGRGRPRSTRPAARSRGPGAIAAEARARLRAAGDAFARDGRRLDAGRVARASPGSRDPGRFGEGRGPSVPRNHHQEVAPMNTYAILRRNGWQTPEDLEAAAMRSGRSATSRCPTTSAGSAATCSPRRTGRSEPFASTRPPIRMPSAAMPAPPTCPWTRFVPSSTPSSSAPIPSPRRLSSRPSRQRDPASPGNQPEQGAVGEGDFTRIAQSMRESGEALVGTLGITAGLDVLDLGCGDGTTALPAAELGPNVLGSISPRTSSRRATLARRASASPTAGSSRATPPT